MNAYMKKIIFILKERNVMYAFIVSVDVIK